MGKHKVMPFLTFNGKSEEAMNFYASVLPNAKVEKLVRYGDSPHVGKDEGDRIMFGVLSVAGDEICFLDMASAFPPPAFSWSTSLYVDCKNEEEFDGVFESLSEGGSVMMGPESIGEIRKCAWVTDRFGVTWQPVWT